MPTLVVLASLSLASLLLAVGFTVTTPEWSRSRVFCWLLFINAVGFSGLILYAMLPFPFLVVLERPWKPDPFAGLRGLEALDSFTWPPYGMDSHSSGRRRSLRTYSETLLLFLNNCVDDSTPRSQTMRILSNRHRWTGTTTVK